MAAQSHSDDDAQIADNPFVDEVAVGDTVELTYTRKAGYEMAETTVVAEVIDAGNYIMHRDNDRAPAGTLDLRVPLRGRRHFQSNIIFRIEPEEERTYLRILRRSSARHDRLVTREFSVSKTDKDLVYVEDEDI